MGIGDGDWGLGIGDWAQSPIPNPQSPIPILKIFLINKIIFTHLFYYINQLHLLFLIKQNYYFYST